MANAHDDKIIYKIKLVCLSQQFNLLNIKPSFDAFWAQMVVIYRHL